MAADATRYMSGRMAELAELRMSARANSAKSANAHRTSRAMSGRGNDEWKGEQVARASDIWTSAPKYVDDEGRFEKGAVSTVWGDEGIGKGLYCAHLVAGVTRGGDPPVVWMNSAGEGGVQTLKVRLASAGADLRMVEVSEEPFDLPRDLGRLEARAGRLRAEMVVLDSLETHADTFSKMKKAMKGLAELTERTGIAIVVVHHSVKSGCTPRTRMGGPARVRASIRASYYLGPQPGEDPTTRELRELRATLNGEDLEPDHRERIVLASDKQNNSAFPPSASFTIEAKPYEHDDGTVSEEAHLEYVEEVGCTAGQIIHAQCKAAGYQDGKENLPIQQAKWMLEHLAAQPFRGLPQQKLIDDAKAVGVYTGQKTWETARGLANVKAVVYTELKKYLSDEDHAALPEADRRSCWVFF